jgi:hypothetical protein
MHHSLRRLLPNHDDLSRRGWEDACAEWVEIHEPAIAGTPAVPSPDAPESERG